MKFAHIENYKENEEKNAHEDSFIYQQVLSYDTSLKDLTVVSDDLTTANMDPF